MAQRIRSSLDRSASVTPRAEQLPSSMSMARSPTRLAQARKGGLLPHPRAPALRMWSCPFLKRSGTNLDEGIWRLRGGASISPIQR